MAGILTDMESAETFKAYESYLLGQPAKAGTVLRQGAFFYIWKETFIISYSSGLFLSYP